MTTNETGLIAWFASNPVAANLLMAMILVAGIVSSFSIRKQTTPDFELNSISIRVPYLGAAPQEVEEGVVLKVEDAVQDIVGITEISSEAAEGSGTVSLKISMDVDINQVLSEVKTKVDAISTFPALAEKPVIYKQEIPIPVLFVALYGDLDVFTRKAQAQKLRDDLMTLPEVNQVEILGDRDYEISIQVSERTLREYGLTMSDISQAIQVAAMDLPGGTINSEAGDILLRTKGQVYRGIDFADLVLRNFADGTRLTLGDIATIDDGFVETSGYGRFNGRETATLRILTGGQQNELATAKVVKDFIRERSEAMPEGITVDVWVDRAHYLRDRLDMMLKNMFQGAILVFLVLSLFLRLKVAFWVIVGIPVTFFGALAFMPVGPFPVTVNVISLFAFILVLGIVVDDAIIIGESVYTKIRADGHTLTNVIQGTHKVATAATFGVLTTIAAFAPMLFIGGMFAPFFEALAMVVTLSLLFSLVESKLILPAHLAHANIPPVDEKAIFTPYRETPVRLWIPRAFQRFQRRFQHGLQRVIHNVYRPLLVRAVEARGVTITVFVGFLILTVGLLGGGYTRVVLFPEVPGDYVSMNLAMQNGSSPALRNEALERIEASLFDVVDEYDRAHPESIRPIKHAATFTNGDTSGTMVVELPIDENRPLDNKEVTQMWRNALPDIAGVRELTFSDADNLGGGAPISFALSGNNYEDLIAAAEDLEKKLAEYTGLYDIRSSTNEGGEEISLKIKPEAQSLGITLQSLGRQVRQAFYGEEAQRIQRGKDELKVMVRYPPEERRSVADLTNMRIRTPSGAEVPFDSVADIQFGQAYSSIDRLNRKRTVTVSSNLDQLKAEPGKIVADISETYAPELEARYPTVSVGLQGSSQEEQDLLRNMALASLAALFLIYALIAIPLKSYSQPIIIMSVIPFGLIGAVIGHIVTGNAISMFSMFGLIALAGVVVNDSLIMVDFINSARRSGATLMDAVVDSGTARFRAIILTSLTTAFGLMPMIFETSVQAQFVIPMAISLSFGILFATVITLFLIPALYMWQIDVGQFLRRIKYLLLGQREKYAALDKGDTTVALDAEVDGIDGLGDL
ncbi:MAG: efflux RND transporter permease subunit [Gammaproteobacteria bacterium]